MTPFSNLKFNNLPHTTLSCRQRDHLRCRYFGPVGHYAQTMVHYLQSLSPTFRLPSSVNPASWMIACVSGDEIGKHQSSKAAGGGGPARTGSLRLHDSGAGEASGRHDDAVAEGTAVPSSGAPGPQTEASRAIMMLQHADASTAGGPRPLSPSHEPTLHSEARGGEGAAPSPAHGAPAPAGRSKDVTGSSGAAGIEGLSTGITAMAPLRSPLPSHADLESKASAAPLRIRPSRSPGRHGPRSGVTGGTETVSGSREGQLSPQGTHARTGRHDAYSDSDHDDDHHGSAGVDSVARRRSQLFTPEWFGERYAESAQQRVNAARIEQLLALSSAPEGQLDISVLSPGHGQAPRKKPQLGAQHATGKEGRPPAPLLATGTAAPQHDASGVAVPITAAGATRSAAAAAPTQADQDSESSLKKPSGAALIPVSPELQIVHLQRMDVAAEARKRAPPLHRQFSLVFARAVKDQYRSVEFQVVRLLVIMYLTLLMSILFIGESRAL